MAGYCYQILTNQCVPPGMQRAVGYKMHCSFVSPIPFSYAVQKGRRLVRERSEELSKNTSASARCLESSAISQRCNPGALYGGATYHRASRPIGAVLPTRQRSRCINVRHAAGHSPDAITCSDTRAGADQNRSPAMFAIAGLRGRTTSTTTKELCSVVPHHNRGQRRNDAGSLVLTKTP